MWGIRVPPVFDPQIIPKKARKEIWTGPSKKMKRCHCHQCWRSSHQEQRYFQLKVFETTNDWVVLEITKHRRVAITPVTQIRCEWPPMAKVAKGYGMVWLTNLQYWKPQHLSSIFIMCNSFLGDLKDSVPAHADPSGVHQPSQRDEVHAVFRLNFTPCLNMMQFLDNCFLEAPPKQLLRV